MSKWTELPNDAKLATLNHLVLKIAEQMAAVVDDKKHNHINDSIVVSSGDLTEQVGMFRLEDTAVGLFEVGIIAQNSGVEPNVIIGIRITEVPEMKESETLVMVIHGFIVDGDGVGWYNLLGRDEQGMLYRIGEMKKIGENEDIGNVERDLVIPFMKGRYSDNPSQPTPDSHYKHKHPHRRMLVNREGSFWLEVRK